MDVLCNSNRPNIVTGSHGIDGACAVGSGNAMRFAVVRARAEQKFFPPMSHRISMLGCHRLWERAFAFTEFGVLCSGSEPRDGTARSTRILILDLFLCLAVRECIADDFF